MSARGGGEGRMGDNCLIRIRCENVLELGRGDLQTTVNVLNATELYI